MKTITINPVKFAKLVLENASRAGSTEWDIYADLDGNLDIRHTTHNNSDWFEIYDLYYGYGVDDLNCESVQELADWMVSDGIDFRNVSAEIYNDDLEEFENIEVEFERAL